jgi:hypothetical protein
MKTVVPCELKRRGGKWLGEAREWIQMRCLNGSDVTWGSQDQLQPPLTVEKMEDFAAHVAAAAINEDRERNNPEKT